MLGVVSWNRLNRLKPRGANHHVLPPMESTNVQGRQMEYPPGNQHIPPWEKENHLQKCLVKLQPSLVKLQPSTLVFRKWTDHQPPPGWSSNFLHPEGGCIQVMLQTKTPKVGFRGRNDGGHYMTPPQTMPYYSRKIPQNYHIFAACFFPPNSLTDHLRTNTWRHERVRWDDHPNHDLTPHQLSEETSAEVICKGLTICS